MVRTVLVGSEREDAGGRTGREEMALEGQSSKGDEVTSWRTLPLRAVSPPPQSQKRGEEVFGWRLVEHSGALGT